MGHGIGNLIREIKKIALVAFENEKVQLGSQPDLQYDLDVGRRKQRLMNKISGLTAQSKQCFKLQVPKMIQLERVQCKLPMQRLTVHIITKKIGIMMANFRRLATHGSYVEGRREANLQINPNEQENKKPGYPKQ